MNAVLGWRLLVSEVRSGITETRDAEDHVIRMYWQDPQKAVFVSDPHFIAEVSRARSHNNPFVLIGAQNTGKNVFINLVVRGGPHASDSTACIDENVLGDEDDELVRFFGRGGVFDSRSNALIHVDYMELAVSWRRFVEKLYKLAVEHQLERTDGHSLQKPQMRIVLGANREFLRPQQSEETLLAHLYHNLAANQHATTRRVADQPERLEAILGEIIAAMVIREELSEEQAASMEMVPEAVVERLRRATLPDEFFGLRRLVLNARHSRDWEQALTQTLEVQPVAKSTDAPDAKQAVLSVEDVDAIELKPNVFGIGVNLNYIIKRLKERFWK